MTSVHVETGEVVEVLTEQEARQLTEQIADGLGEVWSLIKRAYLGRAWVPLGFGSWDDYVDETFGVTRIRLPREDRQEVVASLRESGLSIRAIASATGSSVGTVSADLNAGVQNRTPDEDGPREPDIAPTITGTDGKQYRPADPALKLRQEQEEARARARAEKAAIEKAAKEDAEQTMANRIADRRQNDPRVRAEHIAQTVRGFLLSDAHTLLDINPAEAAESLAIGDEMSALADADRLASWLADFRSRLTADNVTDLRSVR